MAFSLWATSYFKYLPILKGSAKIGNVRFYVNPSSFPQLERDMTIHETLEGENIIQEPLDDTRIWELQWDRIPKFFYDQLCQLSARGIDGSIAVHRFYFPLFGIDRNIKVIDVVGEPVAGRMPLQYERVILRYIYV